LILVDEINRAPAKTQSALLEIMEERQATVDGKTYLMASPFMVLLRKPRGAGRNLSVARSTMDRFLLKSWCLIQAETEEVSILTQFHHMGNVKVAT
jgi:MoxR-like ATPase